MEKLELSEGSKRSQGALATWVSSIDLGNAFIPQNNHNSEKKMVSTKDVAYVQRLLKLKHELWKYNKTRMQQLQLKMKASTERLIGLWFNIEDHKHVVQKTLDSIVAIETIIFELKKQILHVK